MELLLHRGVGAGLALVAVSFLGMLLRLESERVLLEYLPLARPPIGYARRMAGMRGKCSHA